MVLLFLNKGNSDVVLINSSLVQTDLCVSERTHTVFYRCPVSITCDCRGLADVLVLMCTSESNLASCFSDEWEHA